MSAAGTGSGGKGTRRLRRLRGAVLLPVAVTCLLASALVRLTGLTGDALAAEAARALTHPAPQDAPPLAWCPDDPELNQIIARLNEREQAVAEAEVTASTREAQIRAAEARLSQRLAELKAAEEQLGATMARAAGAAEADVANLVAVYEAMKPKEAAPLFDAMEPEFAAGFLGRMRPEAAAAVLAGMAPDRAYALSAVLAGRNARAPVPRTDPVPQP